MYRIYIFKYEFNDFVEGYLENQGNASRILKDELVRI